MPGISQQVAKGIYWIRMPLPFALDHINLWLLEDRLGGLDGWTLIDCGIDSPDSRKVWQQILSTQLMGKPIIRILVTHMHPDHIGNAHWLGKTFNAPLWINPTEYYASHFALNTDSGFAGTLAASFMASHGLPEGELLSGIKSRSNSYAKMVPSIPHQYVSISNDEIIEIGGVDWRSIQGCGHSPAHISLYSADHKLLISGDMLLPKISTNVSVWATEPLANPLKLFLDSIQLFTQLPSETLVCPSHGIPFRGIYWRVQELVTHHQDRLQEVLTACDNAPQSAYDITQIMFKKQLDLHQIVFAMGEALAHLHWWWHKGQLVRNEGQNGIFKFQT